MTVDKYSHIFVCFILKKKKSLLASQTHKHPEMIVLRKGRSKETERLHFFYSAVSKCWQLVVILTCFDPSPVEGVTG